MTRGVARPALGAALAVLACVCQLGSAQVSEPIAHDSVMTAQPNKFLERKASPDSFECVNFLAQLSLERYSTPGA